MLKYAYYILLLLKHTRFQLKLMVTPPPPLHHTHAKKKFILQNPIQLGSAEINFSQQLTEDFKVS